MPRTTPIPKEARANLHERHAAWLEANVGERALELDEIIGYHYEQACEYRAELGASSDALRALGRAAAERLGTAGRRAFLRSDGPAGVNLISRSVALSRGRRSVPRRARAERPCRAGPRRPELGRPRIDRGRRGGGHQRRAYACGSRARAARPSPSLHRSRGAPRRAFRRGRAGDRSLRRASATSSGSHVPGDCQRKRTTSNAAQRRAQRLPNEPSSTRGAPAIPSRSARSSNGS